ncbi:MAG: FitA-like ribbon-helix-helix domain-containing protein [Burkholderiales bacterium]
MPVTLTIKEVPDRVADKLRQRAAASHRSLQGELMAMLEQALAQEAWQARQREPAYAAKTPGKRGAPPAVPPHGRRMSLGELWERSRRLGPSSKSESTEIVRKLRDERHSR